MLSPYHLACSCLRVSLDNGDELADAVYTQLQLSPAESLRLKLVMRMRKLAGDKWQQSSIFIVMPHTTEKGGGREGGRQGRVPLQSLYSGKTTARE